MRTSVLFIIIGCLLVSANSSGQPIKFDNYTLTSNLTYVSIENMKNDMVVRVIKDSTLEAVDEPTFARIDDKLRKEAEGVYETYADMGLNEWITMRIEVQGKQAKLFLNNQKQPALIVNDLKLGENISGAIGFWVDIGTEGFFKDLKIRKE